MFPPFALSVPKYETTSRKLEKKLKNKTVRLSILDLGRAMVMKYLLTHF